MTRLVAITGATGFIGWHVAGASGTRAGRSAHWSAPKAAAQCRTASSGARRDSNGHRSETRPTAPSSSSISPLRSGASPEDFARANVVLTTDVARAAAGAGARLVHISSLA